MTLNEELVQTKCADIDVSIRRLEVVKQSSKEEFLKNNDLQDIACYRLLVAIEAALSLCYHISSKHLHKIPDEYAVCFKILADAGIIEEDLSVSLQKMARFRNLLVHMYWKIDYEMLYNIIQNDLKDLRAFGQKISELV